MEDMPKEDRLFPSGGARRLPAKDPRLSRVLEDCYRAELCAMAAYTYRSMITEPLSRELSDALDRIAIDEMEHFRLLGSLIVSLGGNPVVRVRLQNDPLEFDGCDARVLSGKVTRMLSDAIREEREEIDRYQTLMGRTEDRIVRSFLCQIIADEERHVAKLYAMM